MILKDKILLSLANDFLWIKNELPLRKKIIFLLNKYAALLFKWHKILYCNAIFEYDNLTTPVTLQTYPAEVLFLHKFINLNYKTILDIGANIGQFACTVATMFPSSKIYSFEANPEIFYLLEKNARKYPNIWVYNAAIGPAIFSEFYHVLGKSGKGSYIKENALRGYNRNSERKLYIKPIILTEDLCRNINIPAYYDLIKVDVEGFEWYVLDALKIKFAYIYIEFSQSRKCCYEIFDLFKKIFILYGNYKILYCSEIDLATAHSTGRLLIKLIT